MWENRGRVPARPRANLAWMVGAALLVALVVLVATHLGEAERFAALVERAEPSWLAVALGLQVATYACSGGIWHVVAKAAGYRLRIRDLARLAVEKLTVDQLVPAAGMAGNLVVVRSMARLGLPAGVAMEAVLVDLLAFYGAFALVTAVAMVVLAIHHDVTTVIVGLVGGFLVVLAVVPLTIDWLLRHRAWKPPPWLARRRAVAGLLDVVARVRPAQVRRPRLLAKAIGLQTGVFVLDAATLWVMLRAVGVAIDPLTAFVGLVVASLAGLLSLLPGGLGSFEAGCTAALTLLGVPLEAALTGTLMLRGLTLWLPLVPGMVLARHELRGAEA